MITVLHEIVTLRELGPWSTLLARVVPVLQTMAVVNIVVEPLKAFNLLSLLLENFALVIELPQLLILQQFKLSLGEFLHLLNLLRIAGQTFEILLYLAHEVRLLFLLVCIWIASWLRLLNDLFSHEFLQL